MLITEGGKKKKKKRKKKKRKEKKRNMVHKIHVAVLDTDAPMPSVYAARGLYSSQFRTLLQAAAARVNDKRLLTSISEQVAVHTTAYDAVGHALPPLECLRTHPRSTADDAPYGPLGPVDAILITGSAASAYDRHKHTWIPELQSFIQRVHTEYPLVKIFGSCFGHQIVAQALLSTACSVQACPDGYEIGIHPVKLTGEFTARFAPLVPDLEVAKDSFRIQLIHGDRVVPVQDQRHYPLPSPWINMGSTPLCPVQGLYLPRHVLTYQGHFEFDTVTNRETCLEFARRAGWSTSFLEAALAQIDVAARNPVPGAVDSDHTRNADDDDDDDDSKLAAEMVVLFFAGEDTADGSSVRPETGMITPPLIELKAQS